MVEDLCFHIVDMVQNAVAADARRVTVRIRESRAADKLELEVRDDGRGMDADTIAKAQDPFFTSKSFKKVGLGIPLLKATAQVCRGDFAIDSRVGEGTVIRAQLQRQHLDCPPLGDLAECMLQLLVSMDGLDLRFVYQTDEGEFEISSSQIREQVGGLHFSHPEVYRFLKDFLRENISRLQSFSGG